jgi:hypothetical protein
MAAPPATLRDWANCAAPRTAGFINKSSLPGGRWEIRSLNVVRRLENMLNRECQRAYGTNLLTATGDTTRAEKF